MRLRFKVLVIAGSLLTAGLGVSASATAATITVPVMDTSTFACGNGVCEVGPGNVGMSFAAGLNVTGDGVSGRDYGDDFRMTIISGSLPPGLQLSLPSSEWTVTGTPTKAGTYPFTVQFTPTQDIAPNGGPAGTQQLTITIGAANADRPVLTGAIWSPRSVNKTLQIQGFDVNTGATYTEYATSSGKQIGTPFTQLGNPWNDGYIIHNVSVPPGAGILSQTNPGSITLKDSLGESVTIPLTVNTKYS
jgi:hypothetical protein